jgi:hypothetical protein
MPYQTEQATRRRPRRPRGRRPRRRPRLSPLGRGPAPASGAPPCRWRSFAAPQTPRGRGHQLTRAPLVPARLHAGLPCAASGWEDAAGATPWAPRPGEAAPSAACIHLWPRAAAGKPPLSGLDASFKNAKPWRPQRAKARAPVRAGPAACCHPGLVHSATLQVGAPPLPPRPRPLPTPRFSASVCSCTWPALARAPDPLCLPATAGHARPARGPWTEAGAAPLLS